MKKHRFKNRRRIRNRKIELLFHGFLIAAALCAVLGISLYVFRDRIPFFRGGGATSDSGNHGRSPENTESAYLPRSEPEEVTIEIGTENYPTRNPLPYEVPSLSDSELEAMAEKIANTEDGTVVETDVNVDWRLILVNPTHRLPDDFQVETELLKGTEDVWFDSRAIGRLRLMLDDCEAAGHMAIVRGSYRTMEQQRELFNAKTEELMREGKTREEAEKEAATVVAYPGTSEHQLGLAVDIVSVENTDLEEYQEDTPAQQWLMKNCWKYGFILRYPTSRSEITGIIYEPWHYRYVGEVAAQMMHEEDLCFEEFLAKYGSTILPEGTGFVAVNRETAGKGTKD